MLILSAVSICCNLDTSLASIALNIASSSVYRIEFKYKPSINNSLDITNFIEALLMYIHDLDTMTHNRLCITYAPGVSGKHGTA